MHSAMLIHDDIMDKDDIRRHSISIHKQYEQSVLVQHADADHIGKSLAICLGDLGFFIAWEELSNLNHKNKQFITQKIARELSLVGIAQMQDITPFDATLIDEERILHMYQYKTGRYTIALPIIIGALLAECPEKQLDLLEKYGTNLGVLYQITDDRLNIFGDPEKTGRTMGSDIREGKNTLYRALLYRFSSVEEKQKLSHIFGNPEMTSADLAYVRLLIQKYTLEDQIKKISLNYQNSAEKIIEELSVKDTFKHILTELLLFMQKRNQ